MDQEMNGTVKLRTRLVGLLASLATVFMIGRATLENPGLGTALLVGACGLYAIGLMVQARRRGVPPSGSGL